MHPFASSRWVAILGLALVGAAASPAQPRQRPRQPEGVYKTEIRPHWFDGGARFWYRNDLHGGTREFVLVEAESGTRKPAFDHEKLAAGLSKAAGKEYKADKLPFDDIEFPAGGKAVRFRVDRTNWTCDLTSYECAKAEAAALPEPGAPATELEDVRGSEGDPNPDPEQGEYITVAQPPDRTVDRQSPDKKWIAFIRESNVWVKNSEGGETQLTKDGTSAKAYGMLSWSPDSKTLAAFRIEPGDRKEVYRIQSSPQGGGRAVLQTAQYPLPGDKFTSYELALFDPAANKPIKAEVEKIDFGVPRPRWNRDGRHFTYEKVDRGHQRFRLIEVDAQTGSARNLIDEKTETFVWTAHAENIGIRPVTWLEKTDEILYITERDGWRHIDLIDAKTGEVKSQLTKGAYVVRGVDRVDEEKRQVWFRACGKNPDQDPYFIHYYRVNFDGTDLVALTEGNGSHTVQYSPDRKYIVDTYSRVDLAPVHELRRVADGSLACKIDEADITDLKAKGWEPPEVFVAKGRDSKTDIWGIICRPAKFDSTKKYPVLEDIYAGPQGSFVPKTFSAFRRYSQLCDLGFIVAKMDGMGTANRSKAFHDVCWKNIKDAGFPDRILWHEAAAKKYPYYDISRVGIYGTSAGGQNAMGAVLFHGDFYKAAVAACGCHDNRMDKASWNEQWMGYPVGPQYAASSNVDNAYRLKGKLMLIVGELDDNVPPESTFRVVDALIKAGKDFDLLVMPGLRHTNGGEYGTRRMQDFFVRHLLGTEPPNRNGGERRARQ